MRHLPLNEITGEMFLAHSVFGNDGRILLNKGTKLTPSYLKRLGKMGYTHLYVYEKIDEKWDCTGPLSDRIRAEAMHVLWQSLIRVVERKPLNEQQISFVVEGILKEVLQKEDCVFDIIDFKTADNYLYNHSLNVCILSILMGKHFNFTQEELKEIALGAFLHDLGKAYLRSAVKKIQALSLVETAQGKQHTKKGFDILRAITGFPAKVASIAYQHHEREDGSGYPLGLIAVDIPLYSKIVGTADSFDAMISHRPYRKVLWNDQALQELEAESPSKYNPAVVAALRRSVALYPVGSGVLLAGGEERVVVAASATRIILQKPGDPSDLLELPVDALSRIEKRIF
ncbi:MAG: HD domain-containing protein [Firmicutes bacterium]|nr:HD domain-containing protein [Bacillota bacterium]